MMTIPAPYDDRPYYGRWESDHAHAPFLIVRSLTQLGLADWTATLLNWLGRYDGLEMYLLDEAGWDPDPRLDPVICVRNLLMAHVVSHPALPPGHRLTPKARRERLRAITDELLQLDFVRVVAQWTDPDHKRPLVWNPVDEDWVSFVQRGPDLGAIQQLDDDREAYPSLRAWINSPADGHALEHPTGRQMLLQGAEEA